MRLKSALWVAAYLRRCQVEGTFAVVRRRGAEEAGAIFVRISRLDGTSDLFGPAPQSEFDSGSRGPTVPSRHASKSSRRADAAVEAYLAREIKFDPDVWIVEVEDPAGRNFLDVVKLRLHRGVSPWPLSRRRRAAHCRRCGAGAGARFVVPVQRPMRSRRPLGLVRELRSACQIATMCSAACGVISSYSAASAWTRSTEWPTVGVDEQQDPIDDVARHVRAPWPTITIGSPSSSPAMRRAWARGIRSACARCCGEILAIAGQRRGFQPLADEASRASSTRPAGTGATM